MSNSRVLLLGDANVGKTSLIGRISSGEFNPIVTPTTAAGFITLQPDPKDPSFEFQLWDTAGMERYRSVNKIYFRDAVGAILVFDYTAKQSFEDIEMWKSDFISGDALPSAVMILVGNKYDKKDDFEVNEGEVRSWAEENGILYFPVSALTGDGIEDLLDALTKSIPRKTVKADTALSIVETEKNKKCC
ncbi:Ras-related protein Rab-27B [Tritrichomonas foetus]|uniref:Ras-related protein Rab-27B n=1 Tax=Tritrichomonas foetus TaxID=1144522 RepID=A0A1J4J791_9EUKA|nr:Ras-related protein Rab-27B [Tritrichomonas foetus]|eukprot:OHS93060.1 Ras-related protein Rab-27B [Tritrichomonas foetus]